MIREAAAVLGLALLAGPAAGGMNVSVARSSEDVLHVEGTFYVDAPREVAWAVLTDYDGISSFVDSMKESRSEGCRDGVCVVRQKGTARALIFGRAFEVLLNVRTEPRKRIAFEDVEHQDFLAYAGSWEIVNDACGGVEVTYRLQAKPAFRAPGFIVKRGMKKGAASLLDQVRREIERRAALLESAP